MNNKNKKRKRLVPIQEDENFDYENFIKEIKQPRKRKCLKKNNEGKWQRRKKRMYRQLKTKN